MFFSFFEAVAFDSSAECYMCFCVCMLWMFDVKSLCQDQSTSTDRVAVEHQHLSKPLLWNHLLQVDDVTRWMHPAFGL